MAQSTRKSVLFVVPEVTEGTPVEPTVGTQAVALQDGFSLTPSFETLENAELKSSIGVAKGFQGIEQPEAEISHYVRHSGVEGTEPNYGEFLQSAFGAKSVNATQYSTTAGSTAGTSAARAIIKSTGNASNFERGEALLIKDPVNGYSVRNVFETSGADDLKLGFNLANAPASGVGLGKAILYKPADSGHLTMSLWEYRGNGGAIEMISGARVAEFSMEVTAGEFVNGTFSFQGTGYHFNPVTIASADRYLDFTDDDGTWAVAITAKTYKNPHDVASALQTAMNASGTTETHSVVYSDTTGKYTISTSTSTVLSLLWNTGANAANTVGDKIGFSVAADDTGATSYLSDNAYTLTRPYTPSFDVADPLIAKSSEVMIGDFDDYACISVQSLTATLANEIANIPSVCAESGVEGKIVNNREVTVEFVTTLQPYDADKFRRYANNVDTSFAFNFGEKSGGNWVSGKSANLYIPTCTVSEFSLDDADGVVVMNMTLRGFVDSNGNGEVYLNFL